MLAALLRALFSVYAFLYRVTGGRWGGRVQGLPVLLLTTTGRRTGRTRTTPLGYFEDRGRYVIIASNAGRDRHPGWFHNLKARPDVGLQMGDRLLGARAAVASPEERKRLWSRLIELAPGYAAYERRTTREIPIVILSPASA